MADRGDKRISRADMRLALRRLRGTERALTEIFFRFIDHRDAKPGAVITKFDVDKALVYAKDRLIDAYDINNNGLSQDEIAKMSNLAKLAVQLAREQMIALRFDEDEAIPEGYAPYLTIAMGTIDASAGRLVLTGIPPLDLSLQSLVEVAFWVVWERILVHRYWNAPVDLASNGKLELGEWTDPRNGLVYVICNWVDVDDASMVFYYREQGDGTWLLVHEIFLN
ncbi:hypothetical protein ENSA5_36160 [Enhygromyxa salina]|uniref:Uncharacterized protein n=1 Tax=Enhygromyxa salina TaxID=215803 RepID=A0A2S9XUX5_9BACT|nr:hypothetical protein [Enhygromyxa salina]PRP96540.1 hypothetical protein ENSA5_36160 [Enhygromyxa salina]